MNLLSDKDADILRNHVEARQEVTLTRTLGSYSVRASVVEATAIWEQPMLIQIWVDTGRVEWVQNFRTVEEAMDRLRNGGPHETERN